MRMKMVPNGVASLAARLTDPDDKETYGRLIAYANSLNASDEFQELFRLLGLVSLLGEKIPHAIAELLVQIQAETQAAAQYHRKVDGRLASFPSEIAAGVDPAAIAKGMSESFRQQLAASGLQDTAALLKAATVTIRTLSAEIVTTLKPAAQEYAGLSSTLAGETAKLTELTRQLREQNAQVMHQQQQGKRWLWQGVVGMLLFVLGALYGLVVEKRHTSDVLNNIAVQVGHLRTSGLYINHDPQK